MQDRIQRITNKIHARGMKLGPCMTPAEIIAFEDRYHIRFPEDYRQFLLQIGNGAPGPPHYGLVPLAEPPAGTVDHTSHTREMLANMEKVFPFTKPWIWEDDEKSAEGTDDQVGNGQLYLGTDGCGMNWCLIITGPERGHVWWICSEGMQPTVPKRDFLQWFEDWLDGVDNWWPESA